MQLVPRQLLEEVTTAVKVRTAHKFFVDQDSGGTRPSECASARIHPGVAASPRTSTPATCAAGRRHAASPGVESGIRHGRRHQSDSRLGDAVSGASSVGLRPKQARFARRRSCGDSTASAALYPLHRARCLSVSHAQAAHGPQAAFALEPSPIAALSRDLAMGVARAHSMGRGGRNRDASGGDVPAASASCVAKKAQDLNTLTTCGALNRP